MTPFNLKILGCGASSGVPTLMGWGDCNPQQPRNRRTRASALLEINNCKILIDASPDVYTQFSREEIRVIDAVVLSHFHADHTAGLVDIFFLSRLMGRKLPLFADTKTITYLKRAFAFAFEGDDKGFSPHVMAYGGQDILGVLVDFFPLEHGKVQSMGVRVGNLAYTIDVSAFTQKAECVLAGVEKIVVPARSFAGSHAHMGLSDALDVCARLSARECFLTNMSAGLDYDSVSAMLPHNVSLCFDGQVIQGAV